MEQTIPVPKTAQRKQAKKMAVAEPLRGRSRQKILEKTMQTNMSEPRKYKTGDMHPVHNLMAFVEYDEEGREVWTSVDEDIEAPYRLARLYEQRRLSRTHTPRHSVDILSPSGQDQRQL